MNPGPYPGLTPQQARHLAGAVPAGRARPRVLLMRGLDPPRTAGEAEQRLVALAGGEPFLPPPAGGGPPSDPSWEEILEFDPQVVVLCPGPGDAPCTTGDWMAIEGWNRVEAAVQGRVVERPGLFCGSERTFGDADGLRCDLDAWFGGGAAPGY